jgi:hypothetical protein
MPAVQAERRAGGEMTERRAPYRTRSEHAEQSTLHQWLTLQGWRHIAIPNGMPLFGNIRMRAAVINRMRAEGMSKGAPDLIIPYARGGWFGLFVEMKVGSNKPTPEQADWLDFLTGNGYLAVCCYGFEDAMQTITDYMSAVPTIGGPA